MGTRCNIHFNDGDEIAANIYRHSDGYPDGVLPDLQRFFADVESQTKGDTRFGDPEYLAAKFLVWQANDYVKPTEWNPEGKEALAFTGVAPCVTDHGDIEFVYSVDSGNFDQAGRPTVTHKEA
jgi:hypothetical protein